MIYALCETDVGQQDRLVEVDTVEGNVDKEPRRGRPDEDLEMTPLGEVIDECTELCVFVIGIGSGVGFDNGDLALLIWGVFADDFRVAKGFFGGVRLFVVER